MQAEAALAVLRTGLEDALARSRVSGAEMSRRLGHHRGYLSRVLGGARKLGFREAAEVLNRLAIDPQDFFEALFPLGGKRPPPAEPPSARRWHETYRQLERRILEPQAVEPLAPSALTARAGQVLRSMILRKGTTQKMLSREATGSPEALGRALRGASRLTFGHVFAALEALGVEPGRFFAELFGPDDRDVTGTYRWLEQLDDVEAAYRGH